MPPELVKLLQQLRAISDEKNPFVFQEGAGPLDLDGIGSVLHAAPKRAGVKPFGLYGTRHYFVSALHEAGASLAQARDALGHATINMTGHYTHSLDSGRAHVEKVAGTFLTLAICYRNRRGKESCTKRNAETKREDGCGGWI